MHADFDELPADIAAGIWRGMKLLLDTHALIWAATDVGRLAPEARAALEDGANDVLVSVVSAWEIAIKQSLGKLDLARPADSGLPDVLTRTGFEVAELPLSAALYVRGLAWHHKDPFDRLLIAQALDRLHDRLARSCVRRLRGSRAANVNVWHWMPAKAPGTSGRSFAASLLGQF